MDASAQPALLFAPGSPEEKWLEETIKQARPSPGQGEGRQTTAFTPSSTGPRKLFDTSPPHPHVKDSLPADGNITAAAAAHDAKLHDWVDLIAQKKSEISAATAASEIATQELAALEAAAGLLQTQTQTLKTQTQTQTAAEQAAARQPTQPTPTLLIHPNVSAPAQAV